MVATFVKRLISGVGQRAEVFKCKEGGSLPEYVVVSAVDSPYVYETYIFPSDENGTITDWMELDGSYKGGTDIDLALENAGYEVKR